MEHKMDQEGTTKVTCNSCGVETFHRVLFSTTEDRTDHTDEWSEPDQLLDEYEVLQCLGCKDVCFRHTRYDEGAPYDWDGGLHFYPPRFLRRPPKWCSQLPPDVVAVLDEVYSALAADCRRLAAMGARTLIDMAMTNKVDDVGGFEKKLQELEKKGLIDRTGHDRLFNALDVGHAAAHRGHVPSRSDLADVMDIVENLLEAMYVLDEKAKRLRKSTPRRFPRRI